MIYFRIYEFYISLFHSSYVFITSLFLNFIWLALNWQFDDALTNYKKLQEFARNSIQVKAKLTNIAADINAVLVANIDRLLILVVSAIAKTSRETGVIIFLGRYPTLRNMVDNYTRSFERLHWVSKRCAPLYRERGNETTFYLR